MSKKYTVLCLDWKLLLLSLGCFWACKTPDTVANSPDLSGEPTTENFVSAHYQKAEYQIAMRDGIKLHTVVYTPKDASPENPYPILLKRTPYSCRPYGPDQFPKLVGPSKYLMEEKFIMVYQDVRGRWMSEGNYDNMRPHLAQKQSEQDIDESSDTYDTIDWLTKHIDVHNGRVGQWGISYPGFYTTAGAIEAHPALKASSPQAPIADFYFDDFHHRGAYLLSYFMATTVFGYQKPALTTERWYPRIDPGTPDMYRYYLEMGPLKNGDQVYGADNFFWQQLKEHPNYDDFWQRRNILPHLQNIQHAILTVGGWFDAEDLYGPLMTYKTIEKNNPGIANSLVMGPWSHGDWARDKPEAKIGWINFGSGVSDFFQAKIEFPFFYHHLKKADLPDLPEAYLYDTGAKNWATFAQWPPLERQKQRLYLREGGRLTIGEAPQEGEGFSEYLSDPAKPVPFKQEVDIRFVPRPYMTGDQRFASRRPDVLVFQTEPLEEDLTIGGEIMAQLKVATSGTDADWVVKLIDVYPGDYPDDPDNPKNIRLGHYELLVRSEVQRGRYRNSFVHPEPFVPHQLTAVNFPLQDVLHTFKKGHRIMIHIQSTWFPLIDRNPQKFVDNIFAAEEDDFIKANHRVYHAAQTPTFLEVEVLPQPAQK
ncbi:MAG: CocE/NonD family hydrolase [Bacteroidota bacterium]